jgi:hypothetical protein
VVKHRLDNAADAFGSFVGNVVDGGSTCYSTFGLLTNLLPSCKINFCGNHIRLDPPFPNVAAASAGVFMKNPELIVMGNTLREGFRGITIVSNVVNHLILNNDFGNVTHGTIFFEEINASDTGYGVIANNILNHGSSYDLRSSFADGRRLFLIKNQFPFGRTNIITDAASLPIHFVP